MLVWVSGQRWVTIRHRTLSLRCRLDPTLACMPKWWWYWKGLRSRECCFHPVTALTISVCTISVCPPFHWNRPDDLLLLLRQNSESSSHWSQWCSTCTVSSHLVFCLHITKTRLFKYSYVENFTNKNENFQMKKSGSFHISAQNIDCGYLLEPPRRAGSNKYPQFMFSNRNKKINVYPCKPQFYCIKVGFKGGQNYI